MEQRPATLLRGFSILITTEQIKKTQTPELANMGDHSKNSLGFLKTKQPK